MAATKKFSSASLKDWVLALVPSVRSELVGRFTGTSLNYILKRVWTPDHDLSPTFKLRIAVGLDKASQGQCDFRDMIDDSGEIDWDYVRRSLNKRMKAEKLISLPAENTKTY